MEMLKQGGEQGIGAVIIDDEAGIDGNGVRGMVWLDVDGACMSA